MIIYIEKLRENMKENNTIMLDDRKSNMTRCVNVLKGTQ